MRISAVLAVLCITLASACMRPIDDGAEGIDLAYKLGPDDDANETQLVQLAPIEIFPPMARVSLPSPCEYPKDSTEHQISMPLCSYQQAPLSAVRSSKCTMEYDVTHASAVTPGTLLRIHYINALIGETSPSQTNNPSTYKFEMAQFDIKADDETYHHVLSISPASTMNTITSTTELPLGIQSIKKIRFELEVNCGCVPSVSAGLNIVQPCPNLKSGTITIKKIELVPVIRRGM